MGCSSFYKSRGSIPDLDCNKATEPGSYYYYIEQGGLANSPGFTRFVLHTFVSSEFMAQVALSFASEEYNGVSFKYRTFTNKNWFDWRGL